MRADEWNKLHRPGIGVLVKLDNGKLWHTKTRSEAWELGGGQPVVLLEGRPGGCDLSRILRTAPEEWGRVVPYPTVEALETRGLVVVPPGPAEKEILMCGFQWRITEAGRLVDGQS